MPREDKDIADSAQEFLEEEGIEILCGTSVTRVSENKQGVTISFDLGETSHEVSGSHLLVATGRIPNSDNLNLETAGIAVNERGYIVTDDFCRIQCGRRLRSWRCKRQRSIHAYISE